MAKKIVKSKATKKPPKASAPKSVRKSSAKPASKKAGSAKKEVKVIKRVPPRIIKKPSPASLVPEAEYEPIDTAKAVAFAMSIAAAMKKAARTDEKSPQDVVRLSRRPTTRAQGKATVKFPASDLKEFKKRLLEARARATSGVSVLRATGFNEAEDHEADGGDGTNQTLRLQALGQMGNINRIIQQIDEALHRIDDGTYGVCTSCGQLIRKPRLQNQPFVLTCMECQSAMEREKQ